MIKEIFQLIGSIFKGIYQILSYMFQKIKTFLLWYINTVRTSRKHDSFLKGMHERQKSREKEYRYI